MIRNVVAVLVLVAAGFALTAPSVAAELDGVIVGVVREAVVVVDNQQRELIFAVNPGTRILRNGKPAVMSQLAVGDDVRVNAFTRNSRWTAKMISAIGLD